MPHEQATSGQTAASLSGWQFSMRALLVLLAIVSAALAVYVRFYLLGVFCAAFIVGLAVVAAGAASKRTTLQGIGALVALVSAMALLFGGFLVIWVGPSLVSLTFVVLDEQTGQPVPGATVRLREVPFESGVPSPEIPAGEPGVEATTSAKGRCTVTYAFTTPGPMRLLTRDTATALRWEDYCLQVSAPDYRTLVVPLLEVTGHAHDLTWPQQPPPIRVRVEPLSSSNSK